MKNWLVLLLLLLVGAPLMAKDLVITRETTTEWTHKRPIWAELVLGEVTARNRVVASLMGHYKKQPVLKALSSDESAALGHGMVWWDFRALPQLSRSATASRKIRFSSAFRADRDELALKSGEMMHKHLTWLTELRTRLKEQQKTLEDASPGQWPKMAEAVSRLYSLLGQINSRNPLVPAAYKDGLEALLNKHAEARSTEASAISNEIDPLAQLAKQKLFFKAEMKRREQLAQHNAHLFKEKDDEKGLLAQAERHKVEFTFFLGSLRAYQAQLGRDRSRAFKAVRKELKAKQPKKPVREKFKSAAEFSSARQEFRSSIRASLKELEVTKRQNRALEALKKAEAQVWIGQLAEELLKPRVDALEALKTKRVTLAGKEVRFAVRPLEKDSLPVRIGYKSGRWEKPFPSAEQLDKKDFEVKGLWRLNSPNSQEIYYSFAGAQVTYVPSNKAQTYELTAPKSFIEEDHYKKIALVEAEQAKIEAKNLAYAHRMQDKLWDKSLGLELVLVDGGCFKMGCKQKKLRDADGNAIISSSCEENAQPQHEVCVDSFLMSKFEVTQQIWKKVMGTLPSKFAKGPDFPVESVTLDNVRSFIKKLESQGKSYRLPTEAEWEYGCRSGRKMSYGTSSGGINHDQANFEYTGGRDRWGETSPVGSFPPNLIGLYDMSGNVWEWVEDGYDSAYYASSPKQNPVNAQTGANVLRGGSWLSHKSSLRCAKRVINAPEYTNFTVGFRLVRVDKDAAEASAKPKKR